MLISYLKMSCLHKATKIWLKKNIKRLLEIRIHFFKINLMIRALSIVTRIVVAELLLLFIEFRHLKSLIHFLNLMMISFQKSLILTKQTKAIWECLNYLNSMNHRLQIQEEFVVLKISLRAENIKLWNLQTQEMSSSLK